MPKTRLSHSSGRSAANRVDTFTAEMPVRCNHIFANNFSLDFGFIILLIGLIKRNFFGYMWSNER